MSLTLITAFSGRPSGDRTMEYTMATSVFCQSFVRIVSCRSKVDLEPSGSISIGHCLVHSALPSQSRKFNTPEHCFPSASSLR